MKTSTSLTALILGLAIAAVGVTAASAETSWQAHHPRRVQVNHRLAHQNVRIAVQRRRGDLSHAQARELRSEDRGIRGQERFDASRHDSHLTPAEQRQLNHEENGVSQQIRK